MAGASAWRLGGAIAENIVVDYGGDEFLAAAGRSFLVSGLWLRVGNGLALLRHYHLGARRAEAGELPEGRRAWHLRLRRTRAGLGKTPDELLAVGEKTGLDATQLVHASRLSARVDNNAVADGFQLYLHNFIVTRDGQWVVVQQGMNDATGMARRYHWQSAGLRSFVNEPHSAIVGPSQGEIINLVDRQVLRAQQAIVQILNQPPEKNLQEIGKLVMDRRHAVGKHCVDLKRLGAVLATAYERTCPTLRRRCWWRSWGHAPYNRWHWLPK